MTLLIDSERTKAEFWRILPVQPMSTFDPELSV